MNIIEQFQSKNILFTLNYYGIKDMATSYYLKNIFDNKEIILQYYKEKFNKNLETLDDFIDYIFLIILLEYKECLNSLNDNFKEELNNLINEFNIINENINPKNLISFLKTKYEDVFYNKKNKFLTHDIKVWYIRLSLNYSNILDSNILTKLIVDEPILSFDNYPNIKKKLSNNLKKKLFLEKKNLEQILNFRSDEFFKFILPTLEKEFKNEVLNELYKIYCKKIDIFFDKKIESDGWKLVQDLNLLYPLYFNTQHKFTKDLLNKKNELNLLLDNLLSKNGMSKPINFSSKKYLEKLNILKQQNTSLIIQYLTITHTNNISRLEIYSNSYKESLIDFISTNISTNEFFSTGKILDIDIFIIQESINLTVWLYNQDNLKDLLINISEIIKEIYTYLALNITESEISNDLNALKNCLENTIKSNNNYNYFTGCFFIIAFLEKILRNIYIKVDKDGFFNSNSATYGVILKSDIMNKLIGNETINWLKYYLIEDNQVGKNYRNKIAHFTKIKIEDIDEIDTLKIFYLFIVTLNSIFLNIKKVSN